MSDFLLDMRSQRSDRSNAHSADFLKFWPEIQVRTYAFDHFSLIQTRADDWSMWGPYANPEGSIFVSLTGRIAMEEAEWERARFVHGEGGLACKSIYQAYVEQGVSAFARLNGGFVVVVFDAKAHRVHVATDRFGMVPCYAVPGSGGGYVVGSHQDIVASSSGKSRDLDEVSMAEFLVAGKLHFPHTYYAAVRAVERGSLLTFVLDEGGVAGFSQERYFTPQFTIDEHVDEGHLAHDLAAAFRASVRKRTLPRFGRTAVSLSGGLDSRMILCSAPDRSSLWAFSFFDEENYEIGIARSIARAAGARFIPLRRTPDFFAENAEMCVKISGATGNLFTNHYLGFRSQLRDLGIENILSGFFCDTFFKGYALDSITNRWLRTTSPGPSRLEYDQSYYWFPTSLGQSVRDRFDVLFPHSLREDHTDSGRLAVEARRVFPTYTSLDNAFLLVPQRTLGWYPPLIDNDILSMYLRIPARMKFEHNYYSRMVADQCGPTIARIVNANTGARVNAGYPERLLRSHYRTLVRKLTPASHPSDGSWPNWQTYVAKSPGVSELWNRRSPEADDFLKRAIGPTLGALSPQLYAKANMQKLLFRVLTLSLWIDQRTR